MTYLFAVGIDKYSRKVFRQNIDLSGCVKDVKNITDTLKDKTDIQYLLCDSMATKDAIMSRLKQCVLNLSASDRLIYFHSSHGGFNDPAEGDHERITYRLAHDGIVLDWQIAEVFAMAKKGCKIISITDTCYSRSNARDAEPGLMQKSPDPFVLQDLDVPVTVAEFEYKADRFYFSSSLATQVSYETDAGGIFTQALCKELKKKWRTRLTTLAKRIQERVKVQTANLEIDPPGAKIPAI